MNNAAARATTGRDAGGKSLKAPAAKAKGTDVGPSGTPARAAKKISGMEVFQRLAGTEHFFKNKRQTHASMLEFWQWAFSGLREKEVFHRLGIYVVAQALNANTRTGRYNPDAESDLILPGNIRVNVRTDGAFVPRARDLPGATGTFYTHLEYQRLDTGSPPRMVIKHKADAYVFARTCKIEPTPADLLCAEEWEFYVLTGEEMDNIGWGRVFVRLSTMEKLGSGPISFNDLPSELRFRLKSAQQRSGK